MAVVVSHATTRKRIAILFLVLTVAMFLLIGRLAWLQFIKSSDLANKAFKNHLRDIPVEAKRGIIYDRNGKELAVSVNTDSVYAFPAEIKTEEIPSTAAKLAEALGMDAKELENILARSSSFEWVKRKITPEEAEKVKALKLPGIGLTQESQRFYPKENLASHLLGFAGIDNQGLDGIEAAFDQYLRGKTGYVQVETDAAGCEIPQTTRKYLPPVDGNDLVLTIDEVLQSIVERELDNVMRTTKAKGASAIVVQPKTGEILAIANKPDYNPNHYSDFPSQLWRNVAISNSYEPGSTFKIITAAAALEEKVVSPQDRFFDGGSITVDGRTINCWYEGGHGSQSFTEVMQNSCNVGIITVGLRMGKEKFYKYFDAFGFGQQTGIDLPGEAEGIIIPEGQAQNVDLATMSMGQSIAVTPIQLVMAVSAVANDGILMKPHVVKEIRNKDGTVTTIQPEKVRQVISQETAKELQLILEGVVDKGTGSKAFVEGYRVAGKTGTAQKVDPNGGYAEGKYIASFVGFAPANDPQIAMIVVIDEPVGVYYGGQIAAPVFSGITFDVLRYLGIPSDASIAKNSEDAQQQKIVTVPNLVNMTVAEAREVLDKAGLLMQIEAEGERIVDQVPKPGVTVQAGTNILVYLAQPEGSDGTQIITVPNLLGKTMREAGEILGAMGLRFNPVGTGIAVQQSPSPGETVAPGTIVTVQFQAPDS